MNRNNLPSLLKARQMTEHELAVKSGISPKRINAYCVQKMELIDPGHIEKLCAALNCTPADLLTFDVEFNPGAYGGLAVKLKTEEGFFHVFGITERLDAIWFSYSANADAEYAVDSKDIDFRYGYGESARLHQHLITILRAVELDKRAAKHFDEWLGE